LSEADIAIGTKRTPCNKMRNQTTQHKTTNNTTPHLYDKITKKHERKNLIYVKTTYLNKKKEEKMMQMGDSM